LEFARNAFHRIGQHERYRMSLVTVRNKIGIDFSYDWELAETLHRTHGIIIEDLISRIYGTTFFINIVDEKSPMVFKLTTNDARDPVVYFGEGTYPVFRMELYGHYEGEDGIIELFKRTVINE
jgi:hypothetical protein